MLAASWLYTFSFSLDTHLSSPKLLSSRSFWLKFIHVYQRFVILFPTNLERHCDLVGSVHQGAVVLGMIENL
jgi:hypothetical protein